MTRYILNSGGIKRFPTKKRKFHQEIIKGLGKAPVLLLCNFAQGREYWEVKFPSYCEAIQKDMPAGVKPVFKMAMPATFEQDCRDADVIYIHGGDDHLVTYWLKQFDLPAAWEGKVVAGNSAGSDVLCKHYWTCDWRECKDGLGILPIKVIPHFKSNWGEDDPRGPINWDDAYSQLEAYGDTSLPIHALQEGDFIVVEQ